MSKVQLRNIDLNLLIPLKALLHERNVTRAAERIHLNQSAYASSVVLAPLAEVCGRLAPGITLEAVPWH